LENIVLQTTDYTQDIKLAIEKNFRILFMDEAFVTKNTMSTHAWTPLKNNINIDNKEAYTNVKSVIAAISRPFGLDLI